MTNIQKKILYIVEADSTTGSGKCILELIQLLKNATDFAPIVITQHQNDINAACNRLSIENYSVHFARTCSLGMGLFGWIIAFLCRPFLNYYSYIKLKHIINFNTIYLIHTNTSAADFGAYLHKKLQIPHIWHVREFLIFNHLLKPIIYNLPNYIVNNSSCVLTVSKKINNFIQSKTQSTKIKTIYDGVYSILDKIPQRINNNSNKLRIVCVGNLDPLKGQDVLLKAVSLLPHQIKSEISIDFYGLNLNNFEKKLKNLANELSILHIVNFKGFCKNIFNVLPYYDIGVQPSHSEGFSRVTVEYMLVGLCVIGNGNTAIQELIENEKTGLLYNDFEIRSLTDKIAYCFYNRKKMIQLGNSAREVAIEKYCIEKNALNIINEYRKIKNL